MAREIRDGRVYVLRRFTRTDEQAWEDFKEVWSSHVHVLESYGISCHGVWVPKTGEGESPWQVWMLISYPGEAQIPELTRRFVSGPDEDVVRAKYPNISKQGVSLEDTILYPMEYSPLR